MLDPCSVSQHFFLWLKHEAASTFRIFFSFRNIHPVFCMKINAAVPKDNSISSMSSQWQQATTQRQTTRTKTGFLSITPTSVSRAWRPEEQFHPIWKEGSNTALPGTSEPWNSVAVLWVYTHKRTCSFFLKKTWGLSTLGEDFRTLFYYTPGCY